MAVDSDKEVTWMPAYGPTMRGGTAHSVVKFSDSIIGSPNMEEIDILVAMNSPSVDAYGALVKEGGYIIVNSDIVADQQQYPDNVNIVKVPCITLAGKVNNPKGANLVAIGALIRNCELFTREQALLSMNRFFKDKGKEKFNELNTAAFESGYDIQREEK